MSESSPAVAAPIASKRRPVPAMPNLTRRYLTPKKVIAIFKATGKKVDIAAKFNVCPATVTHIQLGDRHYKITNPIRMAAVINAELVTMACGVEL
jgi:hypothetical protein